MAHTLSWRTNSPTKTTGMSYHGNPGRRKIGPRHTVRSNQRKENQGRGRQAQGTQRLSSRLEGSCQAPKTLQGQRKQGSPAVQRVSQGTEPNSAPQPQQQHKPGHKSEEHNKPQHTTNTATTAKLQDYRVGNPYEPQSKPEPHNGHAGPENRVLRH